MAGRVIRLGVKEQPHDHSASDEVIADWRNQVKEGLEEPAGKSVLYDLGRSAVGIFQPGFLEKDYEPTADSPEDPAPTAA